MIYMLRNRILKGVVTKHIDTELCKEIDLAGSELNVLIQRRFGRSLNIREIDTGSCGACESEIIACNNPIYDLQRFGIQFTASPRHADCLLATGPLSRNMLTALQRTYGAMPEPKFIITLGDCAKDGGMFKDSYYVHNGIKSILPVTLHIPGCPPNPLTIIKTLVAFLKLDYTVKLD